MAGIYVNDTLSTGTHIDEIQAFRSRFKRKFKSSEGEQGEQLAWCLGMEVKQSSQAITINQNQYVKHMLENFKEVLSPYEKRSSPLDPSFQQIVLEAEESNDVEPSFPYRSVQGSLN